MHRSEHARENPHRRRNTCQTGGSEPEKILVDSDLDWGQDLKRLAKRLHEVGAQEVAFLPSTLGDVEH